MEVYRSYCETDPDREDLMLQTNLRGTRSLDLCSACFCNASFSSSAERRNGLCADDAPTAGFCITVTFCFSAIGYISSAARIGAVWHTSGELSACKLSSVQKFLKIIFLRYRPQVGGVFNVCIELVIVSDQMIQ